MKKVKQRDKAKSYSLETFLKMAYALSRIKKDMEDGGKSITNKEEVLEEIGNDLLELARYYKLVEK